jgi:predicted Zn-dependent protease
VTSVFTLLSYHFRENFLAGGKKVFPPGLVGNSRPENTEELVMKALLLMALIATTSCGKFQMFKSSEKKQSISKIYASGKLTVAVFYEEGAEPYADAVSPLPGLPLLKVWDLLEANLKALFPGKLITVPKDLSAMSKLSPQNKLQWTLDEIQNLGNINGQASSGDTTVFNVFFVKGTNQTNANVIGMHLSGTKTIAIFKEVVSGSDPSALVQRYVEQATLIHELGHGFGLVNNGLPMTASHEDTAHQAHCNNDKCVMYWMNEGSESLVRFINTRLQNLQAPLVMFDNACLSDVTSYKN